MISAWYIGAGSLISVFTNSPNQAFSKLKSVYGNELVKHKHNIKNTTKEFTQADRMLIKKKLKRRSGKKT